MCILFKKKTIKIKINCSSLKVKKKIQILFDNSNDCITIPAKLKILQSYAFIKSFCIELDSTKLSESLYYQDI